jgi:amino acid transporter
MTVADLLLGRPLATEEESAERIGPSKGIAIFGLDPLSSAVYGPEAGLTLLIPLGLAGVAYIVPLSLCIIVLLGIVYFSYSQTIKAYPQGGGSYTVASQNLGTWPGLLAAAALMVDYVLTVAVGISAGVGALVSAVPKLQPETLSICLGILALVTLVNLRGVSESGGVFLLPTYVFIACLLGAIALGVMKTLAAGGHPAAVVAPPAPGPPVEAMGLWLLLRAFAGGCTALTGVEAVSNGVVAFREPTAKYARITLTWVIAILAAMLGGIAFLTRAYGIAATRPGAAGYQSVLSMLIAAIAGKGAFYMVTMGAILIVLSLSANTAFAGFPRLARSIALNGFLPHSLTIRGRRLVYMQGVYALAFLAAALLVAFRGVTDRLIPLYAVGAFLAFTLSQAGMVMHWKRTGGAGAGRSMFVNGLGAAATGITMAIVLIAKFTEGAWITILLIPCLMMLMRQVKRHYDGVAAEIHCDTPLKVEGLTPPLVVVAVDNWTRITQKGMRFALKLSPDIVGLHVDAGEQSNILRQRWQEWVTGPVQASGRKAPELVVLPSPYRFVVAPILEYVLAMEKKNPERQVAVLIPELVERRWYTSLLHNHRSAVLKTLLLFKGDRRITVINIPWYLNE